MNHVSAEISNIPAALKTFDGQSTPFTLTLKNTGSETLYWPKVVKVTPNSRKKDPLIFHPPHEPIRIDPGQTATLICKVSAASQYANPKGGTTTLSLKITFAYGSPLSLSIPVNYQTPQLVLGFVTLENQATGTLIATVYNNGKQDLSTGITFIGSISSVYSDKPITLDTVNIESILQSQIIAISFKLPEFLTIDKNSRFTLTARKETHPVHEWNFKNLFINIPITTWYWYILLVPLGIGTLTGIYYLRLYRHPLVTKLSIHHEGLLHLEPASLRQAQHLLKRTHRLETVLEGAGTTKSRMKITLNFFQQTLPNLQFQILTHHLNSTPEPLPETLLPPPNCSLFKIRLNRDFILNIDRCMIVFPSPRMEAGDLIKSLKEMDIIDHGISIIITLDEIQQAGLRKESQKTENNLVTPTAKELTHLLLSKEPLEVLARLIASQVELTRVSPYQLKGGVNRESIFFGRKKELTKMLHRHPANYFIVGSRQVGKSSLLKAILRHYQDSPQVRCHYLSLASAHISEPLAKELKLPIETEMTDILSFLLHLLPRLNHSPPSQSLPQPERCFLLQVALHSFCFRGFLSLPETDQ